MEDPNLASEASSIFKVLTSSGSITTKSQDQIKLVKVQQEVDRQKLAKKQIQQQISRDGQNSSALGFSQSQATSIINQKAKLQGQGQAVQLKNVPQSTSNLLQKNKLNLNKKIVSIGQYTLGEIIGRGAHGKVYKATDAGGKIVALKLFTNIKTELKAQISQEISLLKKLDHPNIVKYIDFVQKDRQLAIVLEFVECGSLEDLIKRHGGCFTETIVAVYIKQVLRGLEYLHGRNVIHRDIKGGNILTTKEGVVKVADFGVATKLDDESLNQKNSNAFAGTPYWMAPEVIEMSENITTSCDIWSLGCTVFELLKGSPPNFDLNQFSAMIKIVKEADNFPLPDGISPELTNFLKQCFQRNPEDRPTANQLLEHIWLKKMSNEQKLGKMMSLKLPQEVTNTIRVHLKKQLERDQLNTVQYQNQAIEAPHTTIDVEQSMRVLSPSTLVEENQAIANIVRQQQFQSRNNNTAKQSLTPASNALNTVTQSFQKQDIQNLHLKTQESSGKNSQSSKSNVILAQKNLIKLQAQRITNANGIQQQFLQRSPRAQQRQTNLIDLRVTTTTPSSQTNQRTNVQNDDDFTDQAAPESQLVTEHHQIEETPPIRDFDQERKPIYPVHQVINIQLKSTGSTMGGSRNRSRAGEVQNQYAASKTTRETSIQWQTTVSNSFQPQKDQEQLAKVQNNVVNQAFSKQFYSATAAPNSIQDDYATSNQQRQTPILADHSVQYFNQNRSPQNVPPNLAQNHSQTSQDFTKGILNTKSNLMPDQKLHIYTQQVPKKSPHVPSAPITQKNNELNSQSQSTHLFQSLRNASDFSNHSNLIARKPNTGQQPRVSSQAAISITKKVEQSQKPNMFVKAATPLGTTLGNILSRTPGQQTESNSGLQTYDPVLSDQKLLALQSRQQGTRTALSTISASSYPTQPLLQNTSDQILTVHHPHHKSLGLIQKKQQTPVVHGQRQRSPTNPSMLPRNGFTASAERNLQDLGDELENHIQGYNEDIQRLNYNGEVADGEVDDQSSNRELLFTQVLERSIARKPSVVSAIANNQSSTHNYIGSRTMSTQDFTKVGKQDQQQLAISLAKELLENQKNQASTIEKIYQLTKEFGFQTTFKDTILKEIGFVYIIGLTEKQPLIALQLINQLCESSSNYLQQFCLSGILPQLRQLSKLNDRSIKVETAFFIGQIYEDSVQSTSDLVAMFVGAGCLDVLISFLNLDYKTDKDLIMISIDSILIMYDKRRRQNFLQPTELSRLLVKIDILSALADLIPRLIRHAENQYKHGSSILNESETDANQIVQEQSNAEKYLERSFELLHHLCLASDDVRTNIVRSRIFDRNTIQACIYECLMEPSAITFQLTKWFLRIITTCQSSSEFKARDQSVLIQQEIELLILEMLAFYMGLVGHIQLASIYDSLKLLLGLISGNQLAIKQVLEIGNILPQLNNLYLHLEQNEKSSTKRSKLLQVFCQIWNEICLKGHSKQLKESRVDQICLQIIQKEILSGKHSQKDHAHDLGQKVVALFAVWQNQDRQIEYVIVENIKLFILINQPKAFLSIVARSQLLLKALIHQQNLSFLLQAHQKHSGDQSAYYEILIFLRQNGLTGTVFSQYVKPPQDWNDLNQRQLYQQVISAPKNEPTSHQLDQTSELHGSSNLGSDSSMLS